MRRRLSGWGGTPAGLTDLVEVAAADVDGITAAVDGSGPRGAIARGLGRAYGDQAYNSGGVTIALRSGADRVGAVGADGLVTVDAGLSLDVLLRSSVPQGWFVPVTPGTRQVTVGGAIANDIHGKNHHAVGSFGEHVVSLRLLLADGSTTVLRPDGDAATRDAFWATVGGAGLTGIVLDATVKMLPIESSRMAVHHRRFDSLEPLMESMVAADEHARYSVAWIDLSATGARLGRGVLSTGDHASAAEVAADRRGDTGYRSVQRLVFPPVAPPRGWIRSATTRAFNEAWFRKAPRDARRLESIPTFFHPLDGVARWDRVYGPAGFVQYQFVVPPGAGQVVRESIEVVTAHDLPVFLSVLKRFGRSNPGPLSFPMPGWTFTIDVPATAAGLDAALARLDALVLDAGGRHYLAKDSHMSPVTLRRGYPRLDEWRAVRDRLDPHGRWVSDQSRRLGLTGTRQESTWTTH